MSSTVRDALNWAFLGVYTSRALRVDVRTSFAGECPAHYIRLFRNDGQVRTGGRVRLTPTLFPLLQRSFADAIGSREYSLRHLHPLANGLHVNWLGPNLLEFDFAALMRQDYFHSLNQIRSEECLLRSRFLGHSIALLSDDPRFAVILSFRPRSDPF